MVPEEITGAWLGNQIGLTMEQRENLKLYTAWPAGWTRDQLEKRSAERDVERRREKRRAAKAIPVTYDQTVQSRADVVLRLIAEGVTTIAELAKRTGRSRSFVAADGTRLTAATRRRTIQRMLIGPHADPDLVRKVKVSRRRLRNGIEAAHITLRESSRTCGQDVTELQSGR